MEVWFGWFYFSIWWSWGSSRSFSGVKKNLMRLLLVVSLPFGKFGKGLLLHSKPLGSNKPPIQRIVGGWQWSREDPFKGMKIVWVYSDHWFLLSWYVDAKPFLLSNDIMKTNIVCIYVYIYIHTYIYQYYSHYMSCQSCCYRSCAPFPGIYVTSERFTPPKTNMDTQNDGLEKVVASK